MISLLIAALFKPSVSVRGGFHFLNTAVQKSKEELCLIWVTNCEDCACVHEEYAAMYLLSVLVPGYYFCFTLFLNNNSRYGFFFFLNPQFSVSCCLSFTAISTAAKWSSLSSRSFVVVRPPPPRHRLSCRLLRAQQTTFPAGERLFVNVLSS